MTKQQGDKYHSKLADLIETGSKSSDDWLPVLAQCFLYQQDQIEQTNIRSDKVTKRLFGDPDTKQAGLIDELLPIIEFHKKYAWMTTMVWPITVVVVTIILKFIH